MITQKIEQIFEMYYLRMQELNSLTDVQQFLLSQFPSSLSLFHHGSQLVQFSLQQIVASIHDGDVLFEIIITTQSII